MVLLGTVTCTAAVNGVRGIYTWISKALTHPANIKSPQLDIDRLPSGIYEATPTMLLKLPNELLLDIAARLPVSALNSLVQTNRFLHTIFTPLLHDAATTMGPDWTDRGLGRLAAAANSGFEGLMKILLRKGFDINEALREIISQSVFDRTIPLLLTYGGDVNYQNSLKFLLLTRSAKKYYRNQPSDLDTVRVLIDAGADISARDDTGKTVLHYASWRHHWDLGVIKLLVEMGVDVDVQDDRGNTPLYIAVDCRGKYCKGCWPAVEMLLDLGAAIDKPTFSGHTVWLKCLKSTCNRPVFLKLLERWPDIDSRDKDGRTALHLTVKNRWEEKYISKLLKTGANICAQDNRGMTPLHLSIGLGQWAGRTATDRWPGRGMVDFLLGNGAGAAIDLRNRLGMTALHLAVRKKHKSFEEWEGLVDLLVSSGADTTIQDRKGRTARCWAKRNKDRRMVEAFDMSVYVSQNIGLVSVGL